MVKNFKRWHVELVPAKLFKYAKDDVLNIVELTKLTELPPWKFWAIILLRTTWSTLSVILWICFLSTHVRSLSTRHERARLASVQMRFKSGYFFSPHEKHPTFIITRPINVRSTRFIAVGWNKSVFRCRARQTLFSLYVVFSPLLYHSFFILSDGVKLRWSVMKIIGSRCRCRQRAIKTMIRKKIKYGRNDEEASEIENVEKERRAG